ncbi:hypothetical protein PPL_09731 [Heterostelium album PN500]|uniref:Uncharacterized protein n=1 Tax=Heterostelium pallidum (strain ATCC 26659 / Pp 5 / PN500) TaxID=670386 RepID=D3BNM8_HETP5|nr:hypothetical protein PPL_09731 [Heterostelium album PN500]EFA76979.1 hypothetical protein PPL_09731 [Heterostelium album PN500]|eukprot:XP_020429110.1 hypothetical protein PPL_09731 [Heterostelium album PN500]
MTELQHSTSYLPTKEGDSYNYEPTSSPFITSAQEGYSSPIAGRQMSMEHATPLEETQAPVFKEKFFEETTTFSNQPLEGSTTSFGDLSSVNETTLGGAKSQVFEQKMVPEYHHGPNVNDPEYHGTDTILESTQRSSTFLEPADTLVETEALLTSEGRPATETTFVNPGLQSSTTSLPSSGITLPATVTTITDESVTTIPGDTITTTTNNTMSPAIERETIKETVTKPNEVTETFTEKKIERDSLGETRTLTETQTQKLGETRGINSSSEKLGYDDYYDEHSLHNISSTENPDTHLHGEPHKPSQMQKIKGALKEKWGHITKNKKMEEEGKVLESQFQRQKNDYDSYMHTHGTHTTKKV